MRRRDFLRLSMLGAGAAFVAPSFANLLLPDTLAPAKFTGKVIIIGAGAAGLYAAYLLQQQGADVIILEAADVYGGRIKALNGFADYPVELGAEFIQGKKSLPYTLTKDVGAALVPNKGEDYYSVEGFFNTESQFDDNPELRVSLDLAGGIGGYDGPDINGLQYGAQQGITDETRHIFNALVANRRGSSLDKVSMQAIVEMESLQAAIGYDRFMLKDKTMLSLFETKCKDIIPKIKLNTQVKSIDYSGATVTVVDQNNQSYTADKVLVTVPISILSAGEITFTPALPDNQTKSFSKITMSAGMKIALKFNKRFWKDDLRSAFGIGYVPEFYVGGLGKSVYNNTITAFITGDKAAYLSSKGEEATGIVVKELDKLFNTTAASRSINGAHIMDWTKQPFIKGAFSIPSASSMGVRELAATPADNKLFFAGEAMHPNGGFGTIHGAMDTAQIAVNSITQG